MKDRWMDQVMHLRSDGVTIIRTAVISAGAPFGGVSVVPELGTPHPFADSLILVDRDVTDKGGRTIRLTYKSSH
jgi:hypothetical protein